MAKHHKWFGCTVEAHRGVLRVRFRYMGGRYTRSTKLTDTPENRQHVEKLAGLIAASIEAGRNPLDLLDPAEDGSDRATGPTVRQYYNQWIEGQVEPMVRPTQRRHYKLHLEKHVLPSIGKLPIAYLSARRILRLRSELMNPDRPGGPLSLKYTKNIIAGSLRAMCRDAREIDEVLEHDPFVGVRWPRVELPGPDPFASKERDKILEALAHRTSRFRGNSGVAHKRFHPPFHAFVHLLFWTGMRPSEATGLHWGDVDLERGVVMIRRSRSKGKENPTKTSSAARAVELTGETTRLLERIRPLGVTPDASVFLNTDGRPLHQDSFLQNIWHPLLRELRIRPRGLYSCKDTFISLALTAGVNVVWLEGQTGVSYQTMRKHYGQYVASEGANQLRKMAGDGSSGAS